MATEEFELLISEVVAAEDPAERYRLVEYFPASRRRISKLEWTYERPGGCGELKVDLLFPYDRYGMDFRTLVIRHFHHVELRVQGVLWWTGVVESVAPHLAEPEIISLTARGYASQAEKATVSWTFSRQALKTAGDIGDIPGVVRSLVLLMPLLFGTETNKPNPLADTMRIDGSPNRPRAVILDNVSLSEAFNELATLAGNYDWGVDENRQFYFLSPETRTASTAEYTADPGVSTWSADGSGGWYGDDTYTNPQPVPPHLPVAEQAIFVVGRDVEVLERQESIALSKNTLLVVAAPKKRDGAPQLFTVVDSEWLDFWQRRLTARVATPFFSEEDDIRAWGARRLRLMGRPQTSGSIKAIYEHSSPVHALGGTRFIDPTTGTDVTERIGSVRFQITNAGVLSVSVELGYSIPPDQYFAEQLRRDATLVQNALVTERVPFQVSERMRWPSDVWSAVLT